MTAEEFRAPLILGDQEFLPGEKGIVHLPIGHLITHDLVQLQTYVFRGRRHGPRTFVVAGIHGDEINGTQICRLLLSSREIRRLRGDLIIIPVANPTAFLNRSRYLPDRRDLNRLFPGSASGSFGARLAKIISEEILEQCTHGIDLHTGAVNRPNLPQIRVSPDDATALSMARAFNAPVIILSPIRENSLRHETEKHGGSVILYEAGEADILDRASVRLGLRGIIKVLRHLEMLAPSKSKLENKLAPTLIAKKSSWIRAPRGGIFIPHLEMGKAVTPGAVLGYVGDPTGTTETPVTAVQEGVIIGRAKQAIVDEGDGLFHIAHFADSTTVEEKIGRGGDQHGHSYEDSVFYPDEDD